LYSSVGVFTTQMSLSSRGVKPWYTNGGILMNLGSFSQTSISWTMPLVFEFSLASYSAMSAVPLIGTK
jgi:hypothetical protein